MRRGTWILAISGMMALHQSGYAADPAADQPSGRIDIGGPQDSGTAPAKRSVKKDATTADARPKNYYKDLFGDDEPAPAQAAKKYVPASAPAQSTASDWADEQQSDWRPPLLKIGSRRRRR